MVPFAFYVLDWRDNFEIKKKKLSAIQKKYFYEFLYYQGMMKYAKTLNAILFLALENSKIFVPNNHEGYEMRFKNRQTIFKNNYFIKKVTLAEYKKTLINYLDDTDFTFL